MSQYMWLLLVSAAVPFVLSFYPPLKFYSFIRPLIYSIALIVIIFGSWDVFATFRGHWSFNPDGVWDLRIINLPLEEWLFFVVIPFCCLFTWEALKFLKAKLK